MRRSAAGILAALCLGGCGGDGSSTEPAAASITIATGASISDTVLARPVQALVVEVRPLGGPRAGLVVRFEALPSSDATRSTESTVVLSPLDQSSFAAFASASTDASGRASVLVRLGTVAGDARVLVTCPELGLADTARFTVLPGAVATLAIAVHDTTIRVGGSYAIGAYAADRFGNRRADAISFVAGPNVASVDGSGRVVVGQSIGSGAVAVRAAGTLDSARFKVVPDANLAFLEFVGGVGTIATVGLDGAGLIRLTPATTPAYPSTTLTGGEVAFQQSEGFGQAVFVVGAAQGRRRLVDPSVMRSAQYPHITGDGQYVYFVGLAVSDSALAVWRARPDGSGLTRVVVPNSVTSELHVTVSVDGRRIAYTDGSGITMMDVASGAKTFLPTQGRFPEISPDNARIAFLGGGGITVMNVDGSASHVVAAGLINADAGLAWLPDNTWLIVRGFAGPLLANATTGQIVTLPFASYYQFSARP